MTYSIYPMEKEDLAQVTEIDREAFPTQWPPANYRQELQNRLAHYIIACDDERVAEVPDKKLQNGFLSWLTPWRRRDDYEISPTVNERKYIVGFSGIWVLAEEAHITNIAVRADYQRQGLGELLMIATIDLAEQLQATLMTLEVRISNLAAQNLYTKFGFDNAGVRTGYYLDNREDAVIMTAENIKSTAFQSRLKQLREEVAEKLNAPQDIPEAEAGPE